MIFDIVLRTTTVCFVLNKPILYTSKKYVTIQSVWYHHDHNNMKAEILLDEPNEVIERLQAIFLQ